ncbi:AraC family transcriptional regulator [Bradyrhizobium sp. CCBAU 53338]|nr:AraC family transcriptional regulator [Bradyrhizobium sp. CCBAU 53338]
MAVRSLSPSPVLGIERFATAEEYRPNEVVGGGVSVPLDPKNSSAVRAILPFPNSLLVLQRSFARRLETNMGAEYGLGMVVPLSFNATINGRVFDNSTVAVMRGKTPTIAVEEQPNTYLMLRFNSDMRNRGWADFDTGIVPATTTLDRVEKLGAIILEMFHFAAKAKHLDNVREPMHETLVAALDYILLSEATHRERGRSFDRYQKLVRDLDELTQSNSMSLLHCDQIARELSVSQRTLQAAVHAVHGMSPHRYLAGKRLWAVRRKLKAGAPMATVKDIALANGFWHMGDFSRAYKIHFGELPSETLTRARSSG